MTLREFMADRDLCGSEFTEPGWAVWRGFFAALYDGDAAGCLHSSCRGGTLSWRGRTRATGATSPTVRRPTRSGGRVLQRCMLPRMDRFERAKHDPTRRLLTIGFACVGGWLTIHSSALGDESTPPTSPVDALIAARVRDIQSTADLMQRWDKVGRLSAFERYLNDAERAQIGEPSVAAITELLSDEWDLIREDAAVQLGCIGPKARSSLPALERAKRESLDTQRRLREESLRKRKDGIVDIPFYDGPPPVSWFADGAIKRITGEWPADAVNHSEAPCR